MSLDAQSLSHLKSLSSICRSARQSVTKFSDIVSSDIAHDYSWPWYLETEEADLKKKTTTEIGGPNFGQTGKIGSKTRFGLLVFLEIAYNDSLKQCVATSRGKTYEKVIWASGGSKPKPENGKTNIS